jgi:hypothetical protein
MSLRCLSLFCVALPAFVTARISNSPFPPPVNGFNSSTLLYALDLTGVSPANALTASTYQGFVSQTQGPLIYRTGGTTATSPYMLWLNATATLFSVNVSTYYQSDIWHLINDHEAKSSHPLKGYVLTNLTDGSVNAAVAVCTALGAVAVDSTNEMYAKSAGLKQLADVRGRDLTWVLDNVMPQHNFSNRVTLVQSPDKTGMSDVAMSMNLLPWYSLNTSDAVSERVWWLMEPPFFALGWGPDEIGTVSQASIHGGSVGASDWCMNLDVLSSFDLPSFHQAPPPSSPPTPAAPVHTATFIMSDGDNLQYILGGFPTDPQYWGSLDRGKVPLGWTLPPTLVDLAPVALHYLYSTATALDGFVGGVSGAAYFYPDLAEKAGGLSSLLGLTAQYLEKAGLSIVNVLSAADGTLPMSTAEAYFAGAPSIDALIHYPYSDYSGDHGDIRFSSEGKPVIGGRFNLWGDGKGGKDFKNVEQAALALVTAARDPASSEGYSLIPLHVWSHNVSDARAVMDLCEALAPGAVQFVTPAVFVQRVVANIAH